MNVIGALQRPAKLSTCVEDEPLFEVIDGHKVELPPKSAYAYQIAGRLTARLASFADSIKLGLVLQQTLFELPAPVRRDRRPASAFVSYRRWPQNKKGARK